MDKRVVQGKSRGDAMRDEARTDAIEGLEWTVAECERSGRAIAIGSGTSDDSVEWDAARNEIAFCA